MSAAMLSADKRWSVQGGGGFLFGLFYLAAFGALAAWIAGSYHLAFGALAGEAFAIGSLGRPGGVIGAAVSIGAGMLGGVLARNASTDGAGTRPRDVHPPPKGAPVFLVAAGAGLGAAIAFVSSGVPVPGLATATLVCAGAVVYQRRLGPVRNVAAAAAVALAAIAGVAAEAHALAVNARHLAHRKPPLRQVLDLRRADGLTFDEFARARYAKQMGCAALAQAQPQYTMLTQGPVKQDHGSLLFYEVLFASPDGTDCPRSGELLSRSVRR